MRKSKTLEDAYRLCIADGFVRELRTVNYDKVKSLLQNADTRIASAHIIIKAIGKKDREWMSVFLEHYDALRICSEALLLFDTIDVRSHECLFACLCVKHPGLDLDWHFLDNFRRKRNSVNYYGEHVFYEDWKAIQVQVTLYISALKKEIEKRLSENS